jgi:haloalkane dehalogenase
VCQDWGGPIGLRVLSEIPGRFARVLVTNTLLPNCEAPPRGVAGWPGQTIENWVAFTRQAQDLPVGQIIQGVTETVLPEKVLAAYDAPFPDATYKQGVLNWPSLIPLYPESPGVSENRRSWEVLEQMDIPLMTAFSDRDPSTAAWETVFQQRARGAKKMAHQQIKQAGHMVQEDQGEVLAEIIKNFIFA